MDIDFTGPAPQASNLAEAQTIINTLWQMLRECHERIKVLEQKVDGQAEEIKLLKGQLGQHSGNSSKPPSSDGYAKPQPRSRREPSNRRPGGQKGHRGHTLQVKENPDHIIVHCVTACGSCGHSLKKAKVLHYEKRQEFDIPELKLSVTEHRVEIKSCGKCGKKTKGQFPVEVTEAVQYGLHIKSLMVYMNQYQLIPYERLQEFFKDVFHHPLSVGTLFNVNHDIYQKLASAEHFVKTSLQQSPLLHVDETGLRVEAQLHWLHVGSTAQLTYYSFHRQRGAHVLHELDVIAHFKGTLIHDHFKPYFRYKGPHGLCNAHHLRELTFIQETQKHEWSFAMERLLLQIKKSVETHYEKTGEGLPANKCEQFRKRYMKIIYRGQQECPMRRDTISKRGRLKQSKACNLLERLRQFYTATLAFMFDPRIPFDNNQAERDIRMTKVRQKISGCFRSVLGATLFCRIRGYISTARKNGVNILLALKNALINQPFIPMLHTVA